MTSELVKLVPGFRVDKDEDWYPYLSIKDQTFLRTKRRKYIDLSENLKEYKRAPRSGLPMEQYRKNFESFVREVEGFATKLLGPVRTMKKEAELTKRRKIREEAEKIRYRGRMNESLAEIYTEDVEMVADDYLPTSAPYDLQQESEYSESSDEYEPQAEPKPEPTNRVGLCSYVLFNEASYLDGLEGQDANILTELKPLVMKYNCRDRVIKAIKSIRTKESVLLAIKALQSEISIHKSIKA